MSLIRIDPKKHPALLLIIFGLGFCMFVFLIVDWIYVEIFSRSEITMKIESKWELYPCRAGSAQKFQPATHEYSSCSGLFTDKGTFKFPGTNRRWWEFRIAFWNDTARASWSRLKTGCHYRVVINDGVIFSDHKLGENRMPPLNTIVNVLERVEKTQEECDISSTSGKPICRVDQVSIDGSGIRPKSSDCDFESFSENYMKK